MVEKVVVLLVSDYLPLDSHKFEVAGIRPLKQDFIDELTKKAKRMRGRASSWWRLQEGVASGRTVRITKQPALAQVGMPDDQFDVRSLTLISGALRLVMEF